jgi:hypothetical protein
MTWTALPPAYTTWTERDRDAQTGPFDAALFDTELFDTGSTGPDAWVALTHPATIWTQA